MASLVPCPNQGQCGVVNHQAGSDAFKKCAADRRNRRDIINQLANPSVDLPTMTLPFSAWDILDETEVNEVLSDLNDWNRGEPTSYHYGEEADSDKEGLIDWLNAGSTHHLVSDNGSIRRNSDGTWSKYDRRETQLLWNEPRTTEEMVEEITNGDGEVWYLG